MLSFIDTADLLRHRGDKIIYMQLAYVIMQWKFKQIVKASPAHHDNDGNSEVGGGYEKKCNWHVVVHWNTVVKIERLVEVEALKQHRVLHPTRALQEVNDGVLPVTLCDLNDMFAVLLRTIYRHCIRLSESPVYNTRYNFTQPLYRPLYQQTLLRLVRTCKVINVHSLSKGVRIHELLRENDDGEETEKYEDVDVEQPLDELEIRCDGWSKLIWTS